MPRDLIIVGAGGFGREVVDVVDAINTETEQPLFNLLGVVDDQPSPKNLNRLEQRGVLYLGRVDENLDRVPSTEFVVGIGSPTIRTTMAEKLETAGATAATLVHPSVTFGFGVAVGAGSVLCAGVRITNNITIGRHVHLNLNATVGHDTVIGDYVSVNPLASISGDCMIGNAVLIGVGGVLLNGVSVVASAPVGGSACVVKDVPAGVTVVGVPARERGRV